MTELTDSLMDPENGFVKSWIEAEALIIRLEEDLDLEAMLAVLEGEDTCILRRVVAAAYLTYWLAGSTLRLDYRALKMALGSTIGR